MSEKFKDIYRIESARLQNWDYGWNAPYFVTICTRNREKFFGEITNDKMIQSDTGKIVIQYWLQMPNYFPFVKLDSFVIMPNHVHGIIVIDKTKSNGDANHRRDAIHGVSKCGIAKSERDVKTGGKTGNKNPMLHNNLSRVLRWFKGRVKFETRKINSGFSWQTRFHDNIIRDDESYYKIQQYIENNVVNWQDDKFYKI